VLLGELVDASKAAASTRSRKAKIAAFADLIKKMSAAEVAAGVGFLCGEVRQGRIGVGYAAAYGVDVPPAERSSITLSDVDAVLEAIPTMSGPGSQRERARSLEGLFRQATIAEQEFLRRLLTGEVRQGAQEGIVVEAIAAADEVPADLVRRAHMLSADLGRVARWAKEGGVEALERVPLRVMTPIKPMLAATAPDIRDELGGRVSVEWKLDGARIQVHRSGNMVRVFTRSLNDITERVPEVVEVARSMVVTSAILDGEAMALRADGSPQSFQETMSRFGTEERAAGEVPLFPFFFDVLHVDGDDLIDRPLLERLAVLDRIVPQDRRVPRIATTDPDEAARFMDEAIAVGQEGVMVKMLDSSYQAGRRGSAWRKVKPVHTYDLVVLAAEWGYGRRTGWLSNIHLGARDPGGGPFVMVGKTFKGMTDQMLTWQTEHFLELEERQTKSTVYVRPVQVVEIAIDGVQASPRYPGGIALRFARVKRYRDDKGPEESDTIDTLRAMLR
jgi:DNA ligase-1